MAAIAVVNTQFDEEANEVIADLQTKDNDNGFEIKAL